MSGDSESQSVAVSSVPAIIEGRTYRKETPVGTARVVINEVAGDPHEVFLLLGRAGSEVQSFMEALGRVISLYLRSSGNVTARRKLALVADQLQGIGGANQMGFGPGRVLSVVDGIGQLLQTHLHASSSDEAAATILPVLPDPAVSVSQRHASPSRDLCPQCNAPTLIYEEGCQHCSGCGYSRC